MQSFQIFTIVGIVSTAILGLINLFISIKNRKNALREHLYKEQLAFILEFNKHLADIQMIIDDYDYESGKCDSKERDCLCALIDSMDYYFMTKEVIVPDGIYLSLSKFIGECFIFSSGYCQGQKFTKEQLNELDNKIFDLQEDIREFMGFDELGEENRRVIK